MKPIEPISMLNSPDPEERKYDFQPKRFDQYLGQQELKNKLAIYTKAALLRNEPLDHLLLFGPPGLGKTTLAQIIAHELGTQIKICSGPMIERTGDLVALVTSLEPHNILFIDEIHRMPAAVEEVLYSAMEHFRVDVIIGQGAGAQSINLPVHPFTLIGATTKAGMLSAPLRSRFGITERLEFYGDEDLQQIVLQNANFLSLALSDNAALRIARASRGTPRIAKKIIKRVRDVAQVEDTPASDELVQRALLMLNIDDEGLTSIDNKILSILITHFQGGPAGIDTIASIIGEDIDTLQEVYEPFLMRLGYLERTPRGRQIPNKKVAFIREKMFQQQI